jgi:16S rRNA (guanine527-N7)-methyltransferase
MGLANVDIVHARAEDWPSGIGAHDLVTARALATLNVLVEYAAPLLDDRGALVAWTGRRDPVEEAHGAAAAEQVGMDLREVRRVEPFADVRDRHLYLYLKVRPTPNGYPRRAGMARKRPLTAST